jgi:hypothetical protein
MHRDSRKLFTEQKSCQSLSSCVWLFAMSKLKLKNPLLVTWVALSLSKCSAVAHVNKELDLKRNNLDEIFEAPSRSLRFVKNDCFVVDLASVHVPQSIAWIRPHEDAYLEELGDLARKGKTLQVDPNALIPLWTYWERIGEAALVNRTGSVLCSSSHITSNFLRMIENRRDMSGVFVVFRGDSHMRVTFQQVVRYLTKDVDALTAMNFAGFVGGVPRGHLDHLFCCRESPPPMSPHGFSGCSVEVAGRDFEDINQLVLNRTLSQGSKKPSCTLCIAFIFAGTFQDPDMLQQWVDSGIHPDVLIANGGAHYVPESRLVSHFLPQLSAWIHSTHRAMELQVGRTTSLILVSSPLNGFMEWRPQQTAYEFMRSSVSNRSGTFVADHPRARERTSYVDFHTLAGVDDCGFSTRFPHRSYEVVQRDRCGHHYHPSDVHLAGGAYVHLAEVLVDIAASGQRRCDPSPFQPTSASGEGLVVETPVGGPRGAYLHALRGTQCNPKFGRCKLQNRNLTAELLQT